ncbi:hypothetical protein A2886_02695 [candidate division WWE3 bacterium RIFCSPHIGHO2_01_FULL_42_13]|uniref:Uncharacterized protein n=1 Tax=candidate division WWE3 bacterium RIFCSPHIGHO2_01_FULL_42_13 TaxID=1802617 RepID=A0A1F4UTZ1_UNCKA|nr:MAG: hypothetical protein A2886_02695 [candidate division WWE3 bacterium RIFCSPHIGHO2_01_FULL_42_13]
MNKLLAMLKARVSGDKAPTKVGTVSDMNESMCECGGDCGCGHGHAHAHAHKHMHEHVCECSC